jgi:hypothetical protein
MDTASTMVVACPAGVSAESIAASPTQPKGPRKEASATQATAAVVPSGDRKARPKSAPQATVVMT